MYKLCVHYVLNPHIRRFSIRLLVCQEAIWIQGVYVYEYVFWGVRVCVTNASLRVCVVSLTVPTSTETVGSNPFEDDDDEDLQGTVKEQPTVVVNNNNNSSPLNVKKVEEVKTLVKERPSPSFSSLSSSSFSLPQSLGEFSILVSHKCFSGLHVLVPAQH